MSATTLLTITYSALTHMEPGETVGPFTNYGWSYTGTECMVISSGSSWQEADRPWMYTPQRHLSCACGVAATGAGPAANYGKTTSADWNDAERVCVEAFMAAHITPA